jgi:glycosyltransferase involved in cell wall biosynthesis
MKIAHVSLAQGPPVVSRFGGAIQRRILEMSRVQVQQGDDVVIFSLGEKAGVAEYEGIRIESIVPRMRGPLSHADFQHQALSSLGKHGGANVIHFHSQPEGSLIRRRVRGARLLSFDYFEFRGGRRTPAHHLIRKGLLSFDALLPCSQYCLQEAAAYWDIDPGRMQTLYNGVNAEQFRPMPEAGAAQRAEAGMEGPVVLYVGRVCEQKGTDLLIDAMALLRKNIPGARLAIAGPIGLFGDHVDGEREWRQRMDAVDAVYLGAVPEEQLAAVYNMAHVFVMPTRELEMFGMAAVEAQACGVPVVASDHGGLRETVPEECGGRFPVGDANALAAMLERLLAEPGLRERAGVMARDNAMRFTWHNIVRQAGAYYASAS